MSLKAFHLFFIAVSVLLAAGIGVWGVYTFFTHGGLGTLALGLAAFLAAAGLVLYGRRFWHKYMVDF